MSQVSIDLSPITRAVDRLGDQLGRQIDSVDTKVGVVRSDLASTRSELAQLKAQFTSWVDEARRTAAVQESSVKLVDLKAQLDREFGHHGVVRRTSTGVLQAFDIGNVSNETVTSVAEELMIQTPRYWLAPCLVALAAWSMDKEDTAERSIREAYARDANKTSLLFALITRRQGRADASARWLRHYLMSLDPTALTREFAVILEATSHSAFGPAGQQLLTETIAKWRLQLRNDADAVDAQIKRWVADIGIRRDVLDAGSYPTLSVLAREWPAVARQLEQASALPKTMDAYEAIRDMSTSVPLVLEDLLDDILDRLVTEYDQEELPLRRNVVYHEAVVEERGDLDRARFRADHVQQALEMTQDILTLQTMAATNPTLVGVGPQTQRLMIGAGVKDFIAGVGRYCANYRADAIATVTLDFKPDHSNYARSYGFKGTQIMSGTPERIAIEDIQKTWDRTFADYIASVSFKNAWYTKRALIAGGIGIVVLLFNIWAGLVALLIGAGIVYYLGDQEKKRCAKLIADAEAQRGEAAAYTVALYHNAQAELVDAKLCYEKLDSQETELISLIETWPTRGNEEEL
jgi:hypothetical protein